MTKAPQAQQDAAQAKWFGCLRTGAIALDDHVSDAGTIGRSLASACHGEYMTVYRLSGMAELDERVRTDGIRNPSMALLSATQQQKEDQFEVDFATRAVLEARNSRR